MLPESHTAHQDDQDAQKHFCAAFLPTFKRAATIVSPMDTRVPAQTSSSAPPTFPMLQKRQRFSSLPQIPTWL